MRKPIAALTLVYLAVMPVGKGSSGGSDFNLMTVNQIDGFLRVGLLYSSRAFKFNFTDTADPLM